MSPSRDIICFANDWANDPMSKKHLVRRLARANRVLWVESLGNRAPRAQVRDLRRVAARLATFTRDLGWPRLRQPEPGIFVLSPVAVPLYGVRWAEAINARLVGTVVRAAMARLGFTRPITYTFVPASAWVVGRLGEERVVYHCVDDFGAFAGAPPAIARYEEQLCRRADVVIACSQPLFESRRCWNPRTVLVRHGVEHGHFARALDPALAIPHDLARIPRPRIGFHGLIAEWVDLALVRALADALPKAHVVLVGQTTRPTPELEGARNVHVLGRRPYAELPAYCKGMDVALLPFAPGPLTVAANPLKLREYLAAGLPVVATDIPEARWLAPHVQVAANASDFVDSVRRALERPGPDAARSRDFVGESWDAKAAEIARILGAAAPPADARALAAESPRVPTVASVSAG
jgi:glycosyltransferase involved in cell wall biosynthesis